MTANAQKHEESSMPSFHNYCIRMVTGPAAGKTWVLAEPVTLIGRTIGCHIRIEDPRISRVQCELHQDKSGVRMRNVGQRNPTCINGIAREEVLLTPGDMISFATVAIILDHSGAAQLESRVGPADSRTTQTFADTIHIREEFDEAAYSQDSRLTGDLHRLLGLLRSLGRAGSLDSLVEQLRSHLSARLGAEKIWVGWRILNQEDIVLYPPAPPEETREAPFDIMREACVSGAGMLIPDLVTPKGAYSAAAPLAHGGQSFGAVVARRPHARGSFSANDLQYLVAIAECAAPLIRAAERLEQMQRDAECTAMLEAHPSQMLGGSPATRALLAEIRRAAVARVNVFFQGETGVGKELAARMLHDLSARCTGPYVVVNSASLSPELFESEMFGHERGAFTGAARRRKGLFELAHGGTLFLDEVTELSLSNQARLLRVVETGTFRPVGSETELKVDVRIVCATNRPLPDKSQAYIRADLYHRLAGIVVRIKPLRERRDEIVSLASHFLSLAAPHAPTNAKGFTQEAIDKLTAYEWPGNVRELHNVVERACFMAQAEYLSSGDLCIEDTGPVISERERIVSLEDLEQQHLLRMLRLHGNSVVKVAQALGLSRSAVYYKLARHGIKLRTLTD